RAHRTTVLQVTPHVLQLGLKDRNEPAPCCRHNPEGSTMGWLPGLLLSIFRCRGGSCGSRLGIGRLGCCLPGGLLWRCLCELLPWALCTGSRRRGSGWFALLRLCLRRRWSCRCRAGGG